MLRSMYSAISGMQAFQTQLDVIGNNIANVNTTGFKTGRVDFADVLSQTQSGGSAPTTTLGGTNPEQVGLGAKVSGIQTLFTQGADQSTGVATDLAINGAGLFVVSPDGGNHQYYTRAGDFNVDSSQNLTLPNGAIAMGYDATHQFTSTNPGTPATIQANNQNLMPMNLNQMVQDYQTSLGASMPANTNYQLASSPDVQVGADGSITATIQGVNTTTNQVTSTQRVTLGHIALASFSNPGGLEKVGDSMYMSSSNSGSPIMELADANNMGSIQSGYLEMSNVDLTQEFTSMIVAQNGFAANSKMIGTDNSILNDIVNMKNG